MGKKCISIVVPMYNEQESLRGAVVVFVIGAMAGLALTGAGFANRIRQQKNYEYLLTRSAPFSPETQIHSCGCVLPARLLQAEQQHIFYFQSVHVLFAQYLPVFSPRPDHGF